MGTEKKRRKTQKNMENQGKTWKTQGDRGKRRKTRKNMENKGKT